MTQMAVYKGVEVAPEVAAFIKHMGQVEEYRESLQKLQAVWDNLALLGQLSGTGIDIGETRASFEALSSRLLGSLAAELQRKTRIDIGFRAQVAIDILVRNLFERTADIGFLAMDTDLATFAERAGTDASARLDAERDAIVARMYEYVRTYSVYHDVILLGLDGRVLAQLDEANAVTRSSDPLILESLETSAPYVETYRATDLKPGAGPQLIYSYRVMAADGTRPVGVLCLCFRLDNECERIFANLRSAHDWTLIALVDGDGRVVASSDHQHVAPGARLQDLGGDEARPSRFGGREYVAATRATTGYQGYMGPGWRGHVMIPLEHAYDVDDGGAAGVDAGVLAALMQSEALFPQALREIPALADRIQADLNRAVWNGNIRQGRIDNAGNNVFSKALLWEIGRTGGRTRDVFARSIRHLNETVVFSMLSDCGAQAALAIDIMDRNLYERANDCRWWALTSLFRRTLSQPTISQEDSERMCTVLAAINALYTVYTDLLLFDRSGRVVAVSNPGMQDRLGTRLEEEWVGQTLRLGDSQQYGVSAFAPTSLYGDRHTYVYCAAVRGERGGGNIGGVAIVFDSEPQFRAMLGDALPRDQAGNVRSGCVGLFVERSGRVVASTDERHPIGSEFTLDGRITALGSGEQVSSIMNFGGRQWAVGVRMSSGYREYKSGTDAYRNDVAAVILVPLADSAASDGFTHIAEHGNSRRWSWPAASGGEPRIEVATFYIGENWYGLPAMSIEACIDTTRLIRVPGVASTVAGMTVYGEDSIPVYDLADLRGATDCASGTRQIIVLRASPVSDPFGIVIDGLGEIPEVPRSALQPVPMLGDDISALLDGLLMPIPVDADAGAPMLMLLSLDRLCERLHRTPAGGTVQAAA